MPFLNVYILQWPQNIDIRTAYLDETTQIGVIELKTCIQAIVAASPELVAKLGQDYTVYAYDYSEYDTPLVGQGMLSWVLASSSSTPAAPALQSKTIVTGRVCKNIMGLFSNNNTQETLEVKLRLVPVPTCLQSEYIESMKSYRDLSRVMPEGFDAQAWTNFLQANPGILQLASQSRTASPAPAMSQKSGVGIEHVQRLMHQNHASPDRSDQNPPHQSDNYSAAEAIEQLPRPPSQASSVQSAAPPKRGRGRPPKPPHELKGRSRRKPQPPTQASFDVGYGSNDDQQEEGPSKKRAKVTKADYPGSSGFAKQPELRVAASTAASVRIHQPTAVRPSTRTASSLEGPPREPTPVAAPSNPISRPSLPARKSNLRCESMIAEETHYESPYPPSDFGKVAGSESNSPEDTQAESVNTPADFASSPPAYPASMTALSSPRLPTLPREMDSGFMSGTIDDLFKDDESRPLDDEDLDVAAQYMRRPELQVLPASQKMVEQDSGIGLHSEKTHQLSAPEHESSHQWQSCMVAPDRPKLHHTASSGNLAQPSTFSNDPIRPSLLHRPQTWAGHQEDHPTSETMTSAEANSSTSNVRSRKRLGSGVGARRKNAIQSKLAECVANGETPPFCENCGAIETPTWRKAWIKVHSGTPEHVVISDKEGGVLAWQSLQEDSNGKVCLFRIIKRTLLPDDEGFTESLLCNPCGIWLHTRKCMRPEEIWENPQGDGGGGSGPRRRSSVQKQGKPGSLPYPPTNDEATGGSAFYSDGSSAADSGEQDQPSNNAQLSTCNRPRAMSVQLGGPDSDCPRLNKMSAAAALQRAIQSSPVQYRRMQMTEVARKDLTPKPTRRVLFPSPTQKEHRGELQKWTATEMYNIGSSKQQSYSDFDSADKENLPPQQVEEVHQNADKQATPSSRSLEMILKTPNRSVTPDRAPPTTGDFFSSAAKALLRPQDTPKRSRPGASQPLGELSPFTIQINKILSDADAVSPPGSNFEFPTLPSLNNTPGRTLRQDFDFSIFDPQDLLSTDVPMASSPPLDGFFGVYEDPTEREDNFWSDYPFPDSSSPVKVKTTETTPAKLSVDARGHAVIDFSPEGRAN
ncbi:MAG: hypothetical protein Q9186_000197 [Xanthomendoza sp. 1 TL-2023]